MGIIFAANFNLSSTKNIFTMKKRSMRTLVLMAVLTCMGLSSCKQLYYQVYDVKSDALKQEDNSLVYENGDMKVMYNLWGKDGSVGFILQNKTDKDLFIDMDKTFFILNGEANDYFKNREYTTSTAEVASMGFGVSQTYWSANGFWPTQYYVPTTASALSKLVKDSRMALRRRRSRSSASRLTPTKSSASIRCRLALSRPASVRKTSRSELPL